MREIDYEYMLEEYGQEILSLCSIDERFDNAPFEIKELRHGYADILKTLTQKRDEAGRSEAGRNYSIAITEAENSLMRAVKGFYSK